jgi:hypothetical protein
MILHRLVLLGGLAALLVACGSDPAPGAEAPAQAAARPTPAGAATEIFRCGPPDPQKSSVVTIDRSCASDADCTFGHEPVCCGPQRAIGVKKADRSKLEGCASCPQSTCQIGPLVAEDDKYSTDFPNGGDVLVTCFAGVCRTQIRK